MGGGCGKSGSRSRIALRYPPPQIGGEPAVDAIGGGRAQVRPDGEALKHNARDTASTMLRMVPSPLRGEGRNNPVKQRLITRVRD
jgi:hypothetical protein